jgi:hypothetical protein
VVVEKLAVQTAALGDTDGRIDTAQFICIFYTTVLQDLVNSQDLQFEFS